MCRRFSAIKKYLSLVIVSNDIYYNGRQYRIVKAEDAEIIRFLRKNILSN